MARDRKRAKQRRDRARRASSATAERRPRRLPDDTAARSDDPTIGPADGARQAPDPLEHASADVDLAKAAEEEGFVADDGDDGQVYADELAPADASADEVAEAEHEAEDELREEMEADARGEYPPSDPVGLAEDDVLEERPAPRRRGREELDHLPSRQPATHPNRVIAFLQASWRELQRVQWPDRRQVAQATGVVIVFVIIAGLYLGLADVVFSKLVDLLL